MDWKKTFQNHVLIKLDPDNESIKTASGFKLYIDTSFDPEKHIQVSGTVYGLPSKLTYTGEANNGMPWKTHIELSCGDKVIMYYLSIMNAFRPEIQKYFMEGEDKYVFVPYDKVFVKYGDGWITPINGYCLIEPTEDPSITRERERMKAIGMELVSFREKTNTHVCFGIVRYMGEPVEEYVDPGISDRGVDIKIGDTVILKKISDVPLQYDLHQKINSGKKLWKIQRRQVLATI